MTSTKIVKGTTKPGAPRRKRQLRPIPEAMRVYLTRREMLTLVPLGMSSIDNLERAGLFPQRIQMTPTRRVVWRRSEVEKFLEERARNRDKRVRLTRERTQPDEHV